MPITPSYPGIYIQEAQSSSHTIVAASTNIAVFVGYTHPIKTAAASIGVPTQIFGFSDYQRSFGGFVRSAAFASSAGLFGDMAVAVNQFFLNGGNDAFIVSVNHANWQGAAPSFALAGYTIAAAEVTDPLFTLTVEVTPAQTGSSSPPSGSSPPADPVADIKITYGYNPASAGGSPPNSGASAASGPGPLLAGPGAVIEVYRRVSLQTGGLDANGNAKNPQPHPQQACGLVAGEGVRRAERGDVAAGADDLHVRRVRAAGRGLLQPDRLHRADAGGHAARQLTGFSLMVIPGVADNAGTGGDPSGAMILSTARAFCERKRAFLVVDPPSAASADGMAYNGKATVGILNALSATARSKNAAIYFPYLLSPDPLTGSSTNTVTNLPNEIPPAATVAGVYAATDVARGVWKAPAGFQAITNNVTNVVNRGQMTDMRQGTLNPVGINCLRAFPNVPVIVFGARTSAVTFDQQWTYVPVRRMALFLEQTLYSNLNWVVFEPNSEPLWTAITMSINAFMLGLFMQGAFAGTKPSEAFKVQCDSQTTSQADIDSGIVNIVVSFAPLKPAEFVVITIAQLAGQAHT